MNKVINTIVALFVSTVFLASCSSPASSNPVSEDGFVTIAGGTYTVGCDEQGNGCRDITISEFQISREPVTRVDWNRCVFDRMCSIQQEDVGNGSSYVNGVSIDMIKMYLSWLKVGSSAKFSLPTMIQAEIYADLDQSLTSDCKIDEGYRYLNDEEKQQYLLPPDFGFKFNTRNYRVCRVDICYRCSIFTRGENETTLDTSSNARTHFYIVKY